ncbi:hypothetical protein [Nocardia sp. CC227C]|uniref:hypothetical protein n=1 Tax=Nocardia sp. CC227C TaxID=3044562 RepID=UPI00278C0F0F|nr:hypothetical protein [Nocardia sp. CC227C]
MPTDEPMARSPHSSAALPTNPAAPSLDTTTIEAVIAPSSDDQSFDQRIVFLLIAGAAAFAAAGWSLSRRPTGAGVTAAGGLVPDRQFVNGPASYPPGPSTYDGLPGMPPPGRWLPEGTPRLTDRFSITRLYPGVYAPPGWSSRDFDENPGITGVYGVGQGPYSGYGDTIPIDPDTTPGATGPWSGNVLTPDPITGKTGISIPTGNKGPNDQNNSLDIDITKKVQLRIVGLKPVLASSFDLNGNPVLAVTYEPVYQVRTLYYGGGTTVVREPTAWTNVSIDQVQQLERMGAFVPVIPAT